VSTSVFYGAANSKGLTLVTIRVTVTGVSVAAVPTGTLSADDQFTCGQLVAGSSGSKATGKCTAKVSSGTYEDVTVNYSGDSNYDAASGDAYVSTGGGDV
jgi:hypothetical protein